MSWVGWQRWEVGLSVDVLAPCPRHTSDARTAVGTCGGRCCLHAEARSRAEHVCAEPQALRCAACVCPGRS